MDVGARIAEAEVCRLSCAVPAFNFASVEGCLGLFEVLKAGLGKACQLSGFGFRKRSVGIRRWKRSARLHLMMLEPALAQGLSLRLQP